MLSSAGEGEGAARPWWARRVRRVVKMVKTFIFVVVSCFLKRKKSVLVIELGWKSKLS